MHLPRIGVVCLVTLLLLSWESIPQAESDSSAIQVNSRHFYFKFHKQDQLYMDRIIGRAEACMETSPGILDSYRRNPSG